MGQSTTVELPVRTYTRADFTALRAWLQRLPLEVIARQYYDEDAPQVAQGLERFLSAMREDLIDRAIVANPQLAAGLASARKTGHISAGIMDVLVKAADMKPRPPRLDDAIGQHMRPKVASAFKAEGQKTLQDIISLIRARGRSWWRSIPRIGQGRAATLEKWLIGKGLLAEVDRDDAPNRNPSNLTPLTRSPLPFHRISTLPSHLSGQVGRNRGRDFCYIKADNDLDALQSYLMRFTEQSHTLRAYTKELERFLLWSILIRKVAISDILVDDCEAYKSALASPPPELLGVRAPRSSNRWRPFTGTLSTASQRMAIVIIRSAFEWLVSVRYLAGNPWAAVKSPKPEKQLTSIQIRKALPTDLFEKIILLVSQKCESPKSEQWRVVRAAILLMAESGLRRSEASTVMRKHIRESSNSNVWLLDVLGKGKKWRVVPLSSRTMSALEAHWADCIEASKESPLLCPLNLPPTFSTDRKHRDALGGYSAGGLANLITRSMDRLADENEVSVPEMIKLRSMTAHGFRHTFGTTAAAKGLPLDVLQATMGHSSLDTTSIYVQAEEQRLTSEAAKLFQADQPKP